MAFTVSYALAFFLRFDLHIPLNQLANFLVTVWLVVGIRLLTFLYLGAYEGVWRYASIADLSTLLKAMAASQVVITAAVLFLQHANFPRSTLLIDAALALIFVGLTRFGIRMTRQWRQQGHPQDLPRLIIFGAGDLGETIVRDMQRRKRPTHKIVGFADDDHAKWRMRIHNVPILGGRKELPKLIEKHGVDEVVVAVNHSRGPLIQDLIELCRKEPGRKVEFKTVPTIEETLRSDHTHQKGFRRIELSDLLRRKPVATDLGAVKNLIAGKTVLVTGAGGSIGSELSRQILRFKPSKLILLEKHNTALFYIDRELCAVKNGTCLVPAAGDITDPDLLDNLFDAHKPQLVFHAAAHKHVSLMEANPQEAVKNNTIGTHLLAEKAARYHAERFLFISTDKAVRPTSVMGVSKRMAEMVIRALAPAAETKFLSVRFGNVLGSSGSAVNIFKEQIAHGGPVTVTHPEVTRYFMTTQEAVELILQACSMGSGGEIFVLNMGEPVKVADVARNLILLSGLEPDKDINIVYTGLRPGEKMYEELFRSNDVRQDTGHPDIFAALPEEADLAILRNHIESLRALCSQADPAPLLRKIQQLVPAYTPSAVHAAQPCPCDQPSAIAPVSDLAS